jgi:tRNA G18 (ribose-2'-O)-methylase SpoU
MNILDSLKSLSVPEIADYCHQNSINASVAMINIGGDFNLSTMVRNANFFGFREVNYVGKKKWDKRGSVGTHHYTPMYHWDDEEFFLLGHYNRNIIAIENNIPEYKDKTISLFDYQFEDSSDPVFVFGEENKGLSNLMLDRANTILTIPNYGSVRSLNVGTTSGIVMGLYRNFYERTNGDRETKVFSS